MSINPQFTYDKHGNPLGVFLNMEDWLKVSKEIDADQWQIAESLNRLKDYQEGKITTIEFDDFMKDLDKSSK